MCKLRTTKKSFNCTGHVHIACENIVAEHCILKNFTQRKLSLWWPRLKREDGVEEDAEKIKPETDWKELSLERDYWDKYMLIFLYYILVHNMSYEKKKKHDHSVCVNFEMLESNWS